MGKRRHPSACKSIASPMKYMAAEETDLSDGVQAGAFRDEETGKRNWDNIGGTAKKGAAGAAIGGAVAGPVGAVIGAGVGMAKDIKQARFAKWYNEGYEESDVGAMADLSDMGFSQGSI